MSYFFWRWVFQKTGRISCLFCVRITNSSHTSFPLTFVPVSISVYSKYPVPCCLCGSWGQSRCFCVGSWSLWWVILLSVYSLPLYVFSHPKYSIPYSVKWSVVTCFGGYVQEKFQSVFLCGSSQIFLSQHLSKLGVYAVLSWQLLWWVRLWESKSAKIALKQLFDLSRCIHSSIIFKYIASHFNGQSQSGFPNIVISSSEY